MNLPANEPEQFQTDHEAWATARAEHHHVGTLEFPPTVSDDPDDIDFSQY